MSLWVKAEDEATNRIVRKHSIRIDRTTPLVILTPDGNEEKLPAAAVHVNVTDNESGIKDDTLAYVWSESESIPDINAKWVPFKNGEELTQIDADGMWYLHIRAEDNAGNQVHRHSKTFYLDAASYKNANLSGIVINDVPLANFNKHTTEYTLQVPNSVTSATLKPLAEAAGAYIEIAQGDQYEPLDEGTEKSPISLQEGLNLITIRVTASDKLTTKEYAIRIKREEPKSSTGVYLPVLSHHSKLA